MAPDQGPSRDMLYPPLEPFHQGHLDVGGGHQIYFEESGSARGFPVVFVHGGPGSRTQAAHRRFFDPGFYRIVLFDQRGCGRSTPFASLAHNTTAHLVADMEALRRHLGIGTWLLFGGSWGSTLALAYAIAHPQRVAGTVLRGVFLGSRAEVDWFVCGARRFAPEAWAEFSRGAASPLPQHYWSLVNDGRAEVATAAAARWCAYEASLVEPGGAGAAPGGEAVGRVKIQLHYMLNDFFLRPDELLDNLWRLPQRPFVIVQGRLDMVCPVGTAYEVARRVPGAQFNVVGGGGHSAQQPEMAAQLRAATDGLKSLLGG
ncbi:MAG TPA: prolyl aminopeptidase [Burkholderiales bacterium]|nr:prolyl aminopeptidase [Burkholderiales bacterium]